MPQSEDEIERESAKIKDEAWKANFERGARERLTYASALNELRNMTANLKECHPAAAQKAVLTVIKNPWFGGFARKSKSIGRKDTSVDVDYAAIECFYREIQTLPCVENTISEVVIEAIKLTCDNIIVRRKRTLPLIDHRRLILFELCPFFDDMFGLFELTAIYGAMRFCDRTVLTDMYASLPLSEFERLLAQNTMRGTVVLLQSVPATELPADFLMTLPTAGFGIRSCMNHISIMYFANTKRRETFEREMHTAAFWVDKKPLSDLNPETLQPLQVPYLKDADFYVDCSSSPLLLEMDFLAHYALGKVIFGLILNACCLDPTMKSRLIALDSEQQQLDRGGIMTVGPIFFMSYFVLEVRREYIVDDALNKLVIAQVARGTESFKGPLKVRFLGEEGVDEGGVKKEFFQLLVEQLMNPDYGMLVHNDDKTAYWFMSDSFGSLMQFELIGIIMGLAVYNHVILDVHFPHALYIKLLSGLPALTTMHVPKMSRHSSSVANSLGVITELCAPESESFDSTDNSYQTAKHMSTYELVVDMAGKLPPYYPTLEDLEELYVNTAKGLRQLLMTDPEEVESLDLTFSVTLSKFGQYVEEPLITSDGITTYDANKKVTGENREEYVRAVLEYYLVHSIAKEFRAFYKGFHRCCGGPALTKLSPSELHLLVCGAPGNLDFDSLKAGARYADGYTETSEQIVWFWEVLKDLSQEDKKKILFFITGSDRTPVGGLEGLKLTISKAGGEAERFPTAHTCFNHLLLPPYRSKDALEHYLKKALEYRHGFGLR